MKKAEVKGWPPESGRYTVGDPKSCVAVCTLFSLDIELPVDKIAAVGKCVTENIGIEKIIKNITSNPNIRFLVLCGEEPLGHNVGEAFICLKKKGIDDKGRIIGATGAMPFIKNVSKEEIEQFRKQIEPIDLIGEEDAKIIMKKIDELIKKDPGPYSGKVSETDEVKTIEATYDEKKELKMDEKGWFTIFVDHKEKKIVVEHYTGYDKKKLDCKITGKTAEEIRATITRLNMVSLLSHAAYLGMELQKAEIALKTGKSYEQEKDLEM